MPYVFSPAALSPTLGAYTTPKGRMPVPLIPALLLPHHQEDCRQTVPGLWQNFIVVLMYHARWLWHNTISGQRSVRRCRAWWSLSESCGRWVRCSTPQPPLLL